MKRCTLKAGFLLTIAGCTLSAGPCFARTIEIGDLRRELVKADWIDQADRFAARTAQQNSSAQPGSFDPAYIRDVIERGKALVVRFRPDCNRAMLNSMESELDRLGVQLSRLEKADAVLSRPLFLQEPHRQPMVNINRKPSQL